VTAPVIIEHDGVLVVRDDLFPGGTKARFIPELFEGADELVYASPPEGGAQTAIAHCAAAVGKRATIFVAKRQRPHPRSLMAKALGAKVLQVAPGYLTVVQARARAYAAAHGARLLPFGLDVAEAAPHIARAALATGLAPKEIWCAAGSGVLARGLKAAWPGADLHAVQIGKAVSAESVGGTVHVHHLGFSDRAKSRPPFPSDPHYDAKAWEMCKARHGAGLVLFWNVTGEAGSEGNRVKHVVDGDGDKSADQHLGHY
jgi:hypothetical protein